MSLWTRFWQWYQRGSRVKPSDIELRLTCYACPEQYDAFYAGVMVGYLRLRWGYFSVTCPDVCGEVVYSAEPEGHGEFCEHERERYLSEARAAIAKRING